MHGKHSVDVDTDSKPEINGSECTENNNSVQDDFEIDTTPRVHEERKEKGTDIEVTFRNLDCAKKYQVQVESFLRNLLSNGEMFVINSQFASTNQVKGFSETLHYDKVSGSSAVKASPKQQPVIYTSPFTKLLEIKNEEDTEEKPEKRKRQRFTCFNCLGNHHLKDCPEEHDGHRISNNRKDFFDMLTPCRYHNDESLSSSGNIRPGVIRKGLRNALNLLQNQLPPYIYTMRLLGYPPGWLEDAKVETSGISLFDSEKDVDEATKSKTNIIGDQYDGTKFIEYPGFNCPAPEGTMDEWKALCMPPMQSHQLLTEALKHQLVTMTSSTAYKRRKQEVSTSNSKKNKTGDSDVSKKSASPLVSRKNSDEPADSQASPSISKHVGVPIVETPNSAKELPDSDKFSAGITEHLNFENLPDAVGKFDNVRTVLGKVRKKLINKN